MATISDIVKPVLFEVAILVGFVAWALLGLWVDAFLGLRMILAWSCSYVGGCPSSWRSSSPVLGKLDDIQYGQRHPSLYPAREGPCNDRPLSIDSEPTLSRRLPDLPRNHNRDSISISGDSRIDRLANHLHRNCS